MTSSGVRTRALAARPEPSIPPRRSTVRRVLGALVILPRRLSTSRSTVVCSQRCSHSRGSVLEANKTF
jgi:hypothetical protein